MEDKHFTEIDEAGSNLLLNTIRIPKNIHYLTDRLPKPNYAPLKTKKIDKKRFLQTLAGYQDLNDSQNEGSNENIRNSMPEIPYHLPKIKGDNLSNYDKEELGGIIRKKKNDDDSRDLSINQRINELLEMKKNSELKKMLENNTNKYANEDASVISIQKLHGKAHKQKRSDLSPSVLKKDDKSKYIIFIYYFFFWDERGGGASQKGCIIKNFGLKNDV